MTAFYKFDAGVNLDTFSQAFGSASGARLYSTGPAPLRPRTDGLGAIAAIPEPATWAMMILGFGAAGAVLRRRRAVAIAAA